MSSPTSIERTQPPGVTLFVSYAHEDRRWLEAGSLVPRLLKSRKLSECRARIVVDQGFLHGGDDWERMIRREIDQCHIAVLLVSRPFLDSQFIREVELKRIEERARRSEVVVIPILVGHCDWKSVPLLSTPQMLPGGPTPLITFLNDEAALDRAFNEIISDIEQQVLRLQPIPSESAPCTAAPAQPRPPVSDPLPRDRHLPIVRSRTWVRWAPIAGAILCAIALAMVLWQRRSPEAGQDPRTAGKLAAQTNAARTPVDPTPGEPSAGQEPRTATEPSLSPNGLFPARLLLVSGEELSGGMLIDHNPGGFGNGWNMKTLGYCTTLAEAANQPQNRTRQLDYASIARIDLVAFDPAEQAAVAEMYYYDRDKIMKANVAFRDGSAKSGVYLVPHYLRYQTANERMDLRRDQLRAIVFTPTSASVENRPTLAATSAPPAAAASKEVAAGERIASVTLVGHDDLVTSVVFPSDGDTLVSAGYGGIMLVWDLSNGKPTYKRLGEAERAGSDRISSTITSMSVHPSQDSLAAGLWDGSVELWRVSTGERTQFWKAHASRVSTVAFSYEGHTLASAAGDGTVSIWRFPEGEELETVRAHAQGVGALAFSSDGHWLFSGGGDNTVKAWDRRSWSEALSVPGPGGGVSSLALSADSRFLAIGSRSDVHDIQVWDVQLAQAVRRLSSYRSGIMALMFSPNGRLLASASADGSIRLWDANHWQERMTLRGHGEAVVALAFSPDGETLASGSHDRTVKLWHLVARQAEASKLMPAADAEHPRSGPMPAAP